MRALLSPDVQAFLTAHPALTDVLEEMAEPLHACCGQHTAVLEVLTDHEDGDFLRLTVHMPCTTRQEADAALAGFDHTWWGHHCHRTAGLLVVDVVLDDDA